MDGGFFCAGGIGSSRCSRAAPTSRRAVPSPDKILRWPVSREVSALNDISAQFRASTRHCVRQCRPVPPAPPALQCPVSPILPADQCLCPVPAALSASWPPRLRALPRHLLLLQFLWPQPRAVASAAVATSGARWWLRPASSGSRGAGSCAARRDKLLAPLLSPRWQLVARWRAPNAGSGSTRLRPRSNAVQRLRALLARSGARRDAPLRGGRSPRRPDLPGGLRGSWRSGATGLRQDPGRRTTARRQRAGARRWLVSSFASGRWPHTLNVAVW